MPRVLVIDDHTNILQIFTEFLSSLGYEVVTAASGSAGLQLAASSAPDAVLLDLRMPGGLSGDEVLSRLRATYPALPVIIVTGNADADEASTLLRMGAFAYLTKPISLPIMAATLEKAIARRSGSAGESRSD